MDLHVSRRFDLETALVVFALLAALLMLIAVTAVSSLDITNDKRR